MVLRLVSIINEETSYEVEYRSYDVQYNGTYYTVLHMDHDAITVLGKRGRQVRKIVLKEVFGEKIKLGWGLYMDSATHNIYVTCIFNSGVLCVSVTGEPLWFTPLSGSPLGLTDIQDSLCVVSLDERCLHLISRSGQNKRKLELFDNEGMINTPYYTSYSQSTQKLILSFIGKCAVSIYQWKSWYVTKHDLLLSKYSHFKETYSRLHGQRFIYKICFNVNLFQFLMEVW